MNTFCNQSQQHLIILIAYICFFSWISFTEIVPSFEPRNVTVKKGADAKEFYDLLTEIGR